MAWALNSLGLTEREMGHHADARQRFEESLALYREINNLDGVAHSLSLLAQVLHQLNEDDASRRYAFEGLHLALQIGSETSAMDALVNVATWLSTQQQWIAVWKVATHVSHNPVARREKQEQAQELLARVPDEAITPLPQEEALSFEAIVDFVKQFE